MNKYKRLASNTIIFAIGSFSSKILGFLLVGLYTSFLSDAEYGIADIVKQGANLLIPVLTINIVESVMRYGLDAKYNKQQVFSTGIRILLAGMFVTAMLIPVFNNIKYFKGYTLLLFLYVSASSFRAINQQFLRTRGHVKLYAFDGILTTLTVVAFNVLFLVFFNMGVTGYLLAIILSDLCSALFIFFAGQNFRYLKLFPINKKIMREMIIFSIPLIPTAVLWWIVSASDKFMIIYMLGEAKNGVYSIAYSFPSLITMVSTIFFQAWQMSAIKEVTEKGDSIAARHFFFRVFQAYQALMYFAAAGALLIMRPLTNLFINSSFSEDDAYVYVPFLVLAVIMASFCTFLSYIYSATMHTRNSFYTSLMAAVTNIILNLILIPTSLGIQGAAIATFASYFICFVIRLFDSRRYIKFKVEFVPMIFSNLSLLAMSITCICVHGAMKYPLLIALAAIVFALNMKSLLITVKKLLPARFFRQKQE